MFVALGGENTAALLVRLGEPSDDEDEQIAVATSVRSALATASRQHRFPGDFGAVLVDGFVDRLDDEFANPAAAMSFLFTDETFGAELLDVVTRRLVEHERAAYPDGAGQVLWLPAYGSVLNRAFVDDDGDDHTAPGWMLSEDPMYAVLDALSRNGDAGRAVFTDDVHARYLLHRASLSLRRPARSDGGRGDGGRWARRRARCGGGSPRRRRQGGLGLRQLPRGTAVSLRSAAPSRRLDRRPQRSSASTSSPFTTLS